MEPDSTFDDFMQARWPTLVRTAMFLGSSQHDAEDIAQTALLKAYRAWGRVEKARDPEAYVFKCLFNAHRDHSRRLRRALHPVSSAQTLTPHDDVVERQLIESVLTGLTLEQRKVITLRILIGFSERHTAEVLGIPAGTVKSRLSRALAAIAQDPQLDYDASQRGERP